MLITFRVSLRLEGGYGTIMGRVTELGRGRDLVSSGKEGAAVGMKNGDGTRTWGKGGSREHFTGISTEGDQKTLLLVG
jgi:hypothetical protein